ncbi:2-hydroxy-3-oxopropionate reductase [Paraburkholderia kirstenboschensis]|uniref:NAD(P)-dependent oxidoreductase n=1 Tax=Paraburkholderia kirstenboschensis TaxID=1245436 RepID=UPI000A646590|nr:NAD(P)-dependent oxidoreductase [Paraburkholderia kirstenboschensis]CAD6558246.1 2-hydroxy-3-oxopropionate reductase [Paraburkholderia kirstenboschensis]
MKIGYIGLGALGGQLARRFLRDHQLTVWDISATAVGELASLGASVASTAAELARRCDVVFLCLPRSADVKNAVFALEGLAAGLSPGKIVVDQTSGVPEETREIAAALSESGVLMMDAAVSASPQIVSTGNANLMVSAPAEVLDRAEPALRAITDKIFRCGPRVGDGQAMKTVNNAMNAGNRLGMLEVLAFGRKSGLTLQTMADHLSDSEACCQITDRMLPALLQGKASTDFALSLMLKDIHQALSLGMTHGAPMPITGIVQGLLQIGGNLLGPQARLEDMVNIIGSMAGSSITGDAVKSAATQSETDGAGILETIASIGASQSRAISYECISAGLNYGLQLKDMSEVLRDSSGWSTGSRYIFSELMSGERPSNSSVDDALRHLQEGCSLASRIGVPLMIANGTRSILEQMRSQFGHGKSVHELSLLYPATPQNST